jgi:YidC/Oxa1 family membrane protein insertase
MFLWQYFYVAPRLEQVKKQQEIALQNAVERKKSEEIKINNEDIVSREDALAAGGRLKIEAPGLNGSISLKGARFDDLTLAKYKIAPTSDSPNVVLLSPINTKDLYFAEFGWVATDSSVKVPDSNSLWLSDVKTLSPAMPATLSWDNKQGLKFFITISIDENYMFNITNKVENYGERPISLLPYGLLSRTVDTSQKSYAILHEGAIGAFDGALSEIKWDTLKKEKKQELAGNNGWFGFTDKYWLTSIIPDKNSSIESHFTYFSRGTQDRFQADYMGQKLIIEPGAKIAVENHFFAGAKEFDLLDKYAQSLTIPLFDRAVDFGKLYFITKPLFSLLTFFHKLVGNFGIAILLLTVTVKLVMFPLANKSYISMNNLKIMQPRVEEIHKKHSDKVAANKAIMELYRQEKVNPMSGCLPMLIQIPVFFALYKVFFVTIEMRQAPFFGWIQDLSVPDPTTIFNLFGLISWNPPILLHVGAWPIIMAGTMFLQQQLNPAPSDPVQAKIMKFLPVIFLFMFASFPAGLVIYWAWNNTLSILQQKFLIGKVGGKRGKKQSYTKLKAQKD